jgi:hypothetical protein
MDGDFSALQLLEGCKAMQHGAVKILSGIRIFPLGRNSTSNLDRA